MSDYAKQLDAIALAEAKLKAKRFRTLEKALKSDSPDDMVKASQIISAIQSKQTEENPKAFFIDPLEFNANLGYKDKAFSLTYTTLKRMSKTPIINSIIKTRKNQVADFADFRTRNHKVRPDTLFVGCDVRQRLMNQLEVCARALDALACASELGCRNQLHCLGGLHGVLHTFDAQLDILH